MSDPQRVAVYTIPSHRSFADALAAGLIARFGKDPLALANGRVLLPNNRAVRTVTEAFVRASGSGLLLPRLIPVGDPELDERVGGALDRIDQGEPVPPAIDPLERLLTLTSIVPGKGTAENLRLATDLARTLDALLVEEIDPARLKEAVSKTSDLARHWEHSLARLELIYAAWPHLLAERSAIDLAERRNRLLHRLADQWRSEPPSGFTVAAGITTAARAVAALLARVARMPQGMVVLPGLWLQNVFPEAEWEALGPDEDGRGEATHPQFHLKLLLGRLGVARGEVQQWRWAGTSASSPARARAVANAMAAPDFSHKWETLPPVQRRLSAIRLAELADPASEGQAIALALRETLETPEKTAALVTPDRQLAARVAALLARWAAQPTIAPASPCPGPPRGRCCSVLPAPDRRSWRRSSSSPCSSIHWSVARARSGLPGSTPFANWISVSAGRGHLRELPASMTSLARFGNGDSSGPGSKPSIGCLKSPFRWHASRIASRPQRNHSPETVPGADPMAAWRRKCLPSWRLRRLRQR